MGYSGASKAASVALDYGRDEDERVESTRASDTAIKRSRVVVTTAGATAWVLEPEGMEPIAFVLTTKIIEIIRADLRRAEAFLSQPSGRA